MKKHALISGTLLLFSVVAAMPFNAAAMPYITGPEIRIISNNIIIKTSIADIAELERTIKSGITKEIVFTAELIRVWDFWPDEFIVSKRISRVVKYDNLRDQYLVSSYDGITRIDNKFTDFNAFKDRIFSSDAINLANVRELEQSTYYVRIIIESKSIEQLPLIGFVMHLVPEVEMTLAKESPPFQTGISR